MLILFVYAEPTEYASEHDWDFVATTKSGSNVNVRTSCGVSIDGERFEVPDWRGTVSVFCNDATLWLSAVEVAHVEGTVTYGGVTQAFAADPEYYRPDANHCNPSQCRESLVKIYFPGVYSDAGPPPDGGSETDARRPVP